MTEIRKNSKMVFVAGVSALYLLGLTTTLLPNLARSETVQCPYKQEQIWKKTTCTEETSWANQTAWMYEDVPTCRATEYSGSATGAGEYSDFPGDPASEMACPGIHDPTHIIKTDSNFHVIFGSGQGTTHPDVCGMKGIIMKHIAPGSNKWNVTWEEPMFGGCDADSGHVPRWLQGDIMNDINSSIELGDFDAPTVHYSGDTTFSFPDRDGEMTQNWVMYYSVYINTRSDRNDSGVDPGARAQACIGRATSRNIDFDPEINPLVWVDDGSPVYCSNIQYEVMNRKADPSAKYPDNKWFKPERGRFGDETEYHRRVHDGYAIDPELFWDTSETPAKMYMTWGSGVVHGVEMDPNTGHMVWNAFGKKNKPRHPAYGPYKKKSSLANWKKWNRPDISPYFVMSEGGGVENRERKGKYFNEAPYVYKYTHNSVLYYYLFVNWEGCCEGVCSRYEIRVGRSTDPRGPYVDKEGIPMASRSGKDRQFVIRPEDSNGEEFSGVYGAGGTYFLGTEGEKIGPGHAGIHDYVLDSQTKRLFTYHYYDANDTTIKGGAKLGMRSLKFNATDGWPYLEPGQVSICELTGCESPTDFTCTAANDGLTGDPGRV